MITANIYCVLTLLQVLFQSQFFHMLILLKIISSKYNCNPHFTDKWLLHQSIDTTVFIE